MPCLVDPQPPHTRLSLPHLRKPPIWPAKGGHFVTVVGKMTTFDLWPLPLGGGAWGAGTNMWHPEISASYESLPTPLATQIPTLWVHISWGSGRGGALILGRCRAFDLFASVDAHFCFVKRQFLFVCFCKLLPIFIFCVHYKDHATMTFACRNNPLLKYRSCEPAF